jgi:hypothetical protein
MATARVMIDQALRALRVTAAGDSPTIEELNAGLAALQDLILAIHAARGPLTEIDVTGPYTPGENQRVRIGAGDTADITLPNSVALWAAIDPYDYGFAPGPANLVPAGSTGSADGARIEIVATAPALYFYRADLNAWIEALNPGLDAETPFNDRYSGHVAALLAERLADALGVETPPGLSLRAGRARLALMIRAGNRRGRRVGEYL